MVPDNGIPIFLRMVLKISHNENGRCVIMKFHLINDSINQRINKYETKYT